MSEKFDFIINRRGGTVLNAGEEQVEQNLRRIFGARAGTVTFVEGKDIAPSVRKWVSAHRMSGQQNSDRLVVGGGDGSIMAATGEIMNTGLTLGALPLGTHNLFARSLGYDADYCKAAAQYAATKTEDVDVGSVNGVYFLYGVLFDPSSVNYYAGREDVRDGNLKDAARKFFNMTAGVLKDNPQTLTVTQRNLMGHSEDIQGRLFAVVNGAFAPAPSSLKDGSALQIKRVIENGFGKDSLSSGALSFYAVEGGMLSTWQVMAKIINGSWNNHPSVTIKQAPAFMIEPAAKRSNQPVSLVVDGEIRNTYYPLNITVAPKALRVCRPA